RRALSSRRTAGGEGGRKAERPPLAYAFRRDANGVRKAHAGAIVPATSRQEAERKLDAWTTGGSCQSRSPRFVGVESRRGTLQAPTQPRRFRAERQGMGGQGVRLSEVSAAREGTQWD